MQLPASSDHWHPAQPADPCDLPLADQLALESEAARALLTEDERAFMDTCSAGPSYALQFAESSAFYAGRPWTAPMEAYRRAVMAQRDHRAGRDLPADSRAKTGAYAAPWSAMIRMGLAD